MKVLLHTCCANCAIYPVRTLREQNHQVTGLFYNPNIHPYQEFARRLETQREYAAKTEFETIYDTDYALEDFLAKVAATPDSRCGYCYHSRMEKTARYAAENGFDAFTTTLLYSRFQNHEMIRRFGEALAEQYEVTFHYEDYRRGWKEGIETSKAMGLYRQQYCGCIYSEKERYCRQSKN